MQNGLLCNMVVVAGNQTLTSYANPDPDALLPPLPAALPLQPFQYLLFFLLRGLAFLPSRRPSFSRSLSISVSPFLADLAAWFYSMNYNVLTLT